MFVPRHCYDFIAGRLVFLLGCVDAGVRTQDLQDEKQTRCLSLSQTVNTKTTALGRPWLITAPYEVLVGTKVVATTLQYLHHKYITYIRYDTPSSVYYSRTALKINCSFYLTDVDDLCRTVTESMYAQQLQGLRVKQQLQEAIHATQHLPLGQLHVEQNPAV